MNCPVCASSLKPAVLLDPDDSHLGLRGLECPKDHGVFLPSDLYFAWRDAGATSDSTLSASELATNEDDLKRAKICPQDARIMTRYRVTADGSFWLDRCATCGGVWFDGSEWQVLNAADLTAHLPSVFSDAWQRQMEAPAAQTVWTEQLKARVGEEDVDRVDAFRSWLRSHAHRDLLTARLLDSDATEPGSPA